MSKPGKRNGCPMCNPDWKPPKRMRQEMDRGSIFAFTCDVTEEVGYAFNHSLYTDSEAMEQIAHTLRDEAHTEPKKEIVN